MTIVAGRGASALCEALDRDRMTVERKGSGLVVRPAALVGAELLEQLQRYKPELLSALRRAEDRGRWAALRACRGCDAQFTADGDELCAWCEQADVFGRRPYTAPAASATRTLRTLAGHLEREVSWPQVDESQ